MFPDSRDDLAHDRLWPPSLTWCEDERATIDEHLAAEESLLNQLDSAGGSGVLRVWEQPYPVVILGRSNRPEVEASVEACAADGIPVLRRCSGGGTVVLGPGCLCYSLVLPIGERHRSLGVSLVTADIMQRLAAAWSQPDAPVTVHGVSDLVCQGRKFSGNSQRWRKNALLHHGTVLYRFDLAQISRYLRFPSRIPDYRGDRSHADFVGNLALERSEIIQRLRTAWNADLEDARRL